MRFRLRALATTVTAAVVTLAPMSVSPAHAAAAFDLYGLRSPGLHITSGSCRHITVTASTDAPASVADVDATVDLWRGTEQVDSVDLTPVNGDVQNLSGDYYFCPGIDEPGKHRLGTTEVTWYDQDYNSASFIDGSRGTMIAKQATHSSLSATRSGARRTFYAHGTYFYCGWNWAGNLNNGWHNDPAGVNVTLQRRPRSGVGQWKNLATHRTNSRGRTTFSTTASRVFQYRVVIAGSAHSWRGASAALTK